MLRIRLFVPINCFTPFVARAKTPFQQRRVFMNKSGCLLVVLALFGWQASASDRTGQFSVGGGLGPVLSAPWMDKNARQKFSIGPAASVFARYHHASDKSGWELSLDSLLPRGSQDFRSHSATLSFFWRYLPEKQWRPILAFGLGAATVDNHFTARDHTNAIYKIKLGMEYEYAPQLDLFFHLDHFSLFKDFGADPNIHQLRPTIGLTYFFSPPASASPSAEKSAATADGDSDGDGVSDSRDRCPGTSKSTAVNELGCAVKQSFEIRLDLKFAPNSAKLAEGSEGALREVATLMKQESSLKVEVQGHTDSRGNPSRNLALSKERAEAVKKALVEGHGISSDRLSARGFGSKEPIADNATPAGRILNRRVTARVIN
jgi:OmpA-OmpF porin, OOP family